MKYEVEITNKKTNEVTVVETETFKKEYSNRKRRSRS